jgi:hypothetical protein
MFDKLVDYMENRIAGGKLPYPKLFMPYGNKKVDLFNVPDMSDDQIKSIVDELLNKGK